MKAASPTLANVALLFKRNPNAGRALVILLILVGVSLTPLTLIGVLWFYIRSYYRHMPYGMEPRLHNLPPITQLSMAIGGIFIWVVAWFITHVVKKVVGEIQTGFLLGFLAVNGLFSLVIIRSFNKWRANEIKKLSEGDRHGSAAFATVNDYYEGLATKEPGIYIGDKMLRYNKSGHMMVCSGPGGGKFVSVLAPNLLGEGEYKGSWVIIDPKGECAAVTARYQRSIGQDVRILDPWGLVDKNGSTYNPLDLLLSNDPEALSDDVSVIAQMIVPDSEGRESFFVDRARSLISGLLMHLALAYEPKSRTLTTLWRWLRLTSEDWDSLLAEMKVSENEIVQGTANEMLNIKQNSNKTYGSIMASAQQFTDFLKSPALQRSLENSNFNINDLPKGKTTLYVIIPADKLESQFQWLRLVTTTSLRAVIRNKNKRVTFVLDEFAQLGKLNGIENFMAISRGYNVTMMIVLQSLMQLKQHYRDTWETFIGNTAVHQFFSISDNFTADYVSKSYGVTTRFTQLNENGGSDASARPLITPDELKRSSAKHIFLQVEQRPPYYFVKHPYYLDVELVKRADPNPYFDNGKINYDMPRR